MRKSIVALLACALLAGAFAWTLTGAFARKSLSWCTSVETHSSNTRKIFAVHIESALFLSRLQASGALVIVLREKPSNGYSF